MLTGRKFSKIERTSNLGDGYLGLLSPNNKRKEAIIGILDPGDWKKDTDFPHDMERTLIHELVHLHLL